MLELKNVSIRLRQTGETPVRSVSFSIRPGEVLGLVGESGSGKSLTSKCIMGLLNPRQFEASGSIRWNGEELLNAGRKQAEIRGSQIGMIMQNPMTAFAPMLPIGKQLEMGFPLKDRQDRQRFRTELGEVLERVKLPEMRSIMKQYPDALSGGMLQRVMIAVTVLKKPALLIADECTTAVDAASEYCILQELQKMKAGGMSMMIVTHDFGVAARLCDTVAVMKDGEIIESGSTQDVFRSPRHPYTKLLAESSVLFQEGTCSEL